MECINLIMPIFNEAECTESNLRSLISTLGARRDYIFRIQIIENGSTDGTKEIVRKLMHEFPEVVHALFLDFPDYGIALRAGMEKISSGRAFICQVDAVPLDFLDESIAQKSVDLILGSRRHPEASMDKRPWVRKFLTNGLNIILRVVFCSPFHDTHGVKFMNLDKMLPIARDCKLDGGIFETEMCLRANIMGLRVLELPISVKDYTPPKKSYLYKIVRNVWLVIRLFCIFLFDGLYFRKNQ